jgi:hypothetical protein
MNADVVGHAVPFRSSDSVTFIPAFVGSPSINRETHDLPRVVRPSPPGVGPSTG